MPNRIIRDAVLDSERYLSLSHPAERLLFLELLLLADDYGITPAGPGFLSRRTTACAGMVPEMSNRLLSSLADVDLIRVYVAESGSRFAFIPRFGNTPRAKKPKWPMPIDIDSSNEINALREKRLASAKHTHTNATETETETETETVNTESLGDAAPAAKASATKGARLPEGWKLPKSWGEWAIQEWRWTADTVRMEADKFADYWHSKAGRDAAKRDWQATWRNWCRNATPSKATLPVTVPGPEVWKPEAPLTASEMAAQAELRRKAVSAIKRVS